MRSSTGRRPSPAESRSWERSLPVVAQDLVQAELGDVEVLVEFPLPLSSKRIDVVLAGEHPRTRQPNYVVVELKQWSQARSWEGDPELVAVAGMPGGPRLHPVAQVRGYCQYLQQFVGSLADMPNALSGAAYLHNAGNEEEIRDLYTLPQDRLGRLFTSARRSEWLEFLRSQLAPDASGAPYADQLLGSSVGPSKQLLALAAVEIREREQFVLLDGQRLAFDLVRHAVERARESDRKRVVIVTGGPGTGKSVVALSLLGDLARRGRTVLHATGSRSFTQTLRKVAGHRSPPTRTLFKFFNDFMSAERNGLDVLILDEAHRIRETSVSRWTRKDFRHEARPQLDELVSAARVPVFLLDQHQVVRPGELGTVADIESYAYRLGLEVQRVELDAQFRCGGSARYVRWVEALLGLRDEPPHVWRGDAAFDLDVADSPQELTARLATRLEEGYGARITAGYCWPWSDPRPDGSLVDDVRIGDWHKPWNLRGDRSAGGAPPAALWATSSGGFDQVGCVYTAQGFEYDWNGVIVGPDLVWRTDRWVARREHNRDPDFRSRSKVSDAEFDRLIRNVYKVLLTRGMVGTLLYSVDEETQQHLRRLVTSGRSNEARRRVDLRLS